MKGKFVISLDFELYWGVRDKRKLADYKPNILGVWDVVPKMLELYKKHNVKATFATVGFLYAKNKKELEKFLPAQKPSYLDTNLSPYDYLSTLPDTDTETELQCFFAPQLIAQIQEDGNHEIASHTFSHYYCLEDGQKIEEFKQDTEANKKIAKNSGIQTKSIVFPRNQKNAAYLEICAQNNITSYRGNEKKWFYREQKGEDEKPIKRIFRLLDTYLNLSGHNCYTLEEVKNETPYNIPSSRFLRPYTSKLKFAENLRLKRITSSMTYAAKNNLIYHLWWHPHNFGVNQKENFLFLSKILAHYSYLENKYGFQSMTMNEISNLIQEERE